MEVENMKKVLLLLLGLFLSRKRRKQILFCFFHFGKEKKAKFIGFAQKRSPVKLTVNLEFEGTDLLFPAAPLFIVLFKDCKKEKREWKRKGEQQRTE